MLGKQPCLPRTTSSRSLLIPCDDSDGESATFCNNEQATEKGPGSALCSPCKIVIGFDVGAEKKSLSDVCGSPRSVLDSSAVLTTQDKQQMVARSPRSGLGSLLASKNVSEDNVALVLPMETVNVQSVPLVEEGKDINENINGSLGFPLQSPVKVAAYPSKVCNSDLGSSACQGQVMYANMQKGVVEDELLDVDICPHRAGSCIQSLHDGNTPMTLNPVIGTGFAADDTSAEQKQSFAIVSKDDNIYGTAPRMSACNKELDNAYCDNQPANTLPFHESDCTEGSGLSCDEQTWQHACLDAEERGIRQSIFSASSPPPRPPGTRSLTGATPGFLEMCNFCSRSLRLGKDIFMYRGDQPFCSVECRYQKIVLDERKAKRGS